MSFAKALSPTLREVRILCCQTGAASAGTRYVVILNPYAPTMIVGTRQFIASTYPLLKQHNPDLPIMIREAKGTPARVFARFGASAAFLEFRNVD